jgi:hypothetical protein
MAAKGDVMTGNCINPGKIESWQLDAYLDGLGDLPVAEHLERCPACRQEMISMKQAEAQISAALFRLRCPDSDQLLNYRWGLLPEDRMLITAAHLAECPHCIYEAEQLKAVPEMKTEPASSLSGFIREGVAFLVTRTLTQQGLASAVVRSVDTEQSLSAQGQISKANIFVVDELDWNIALHQWSRPDETCFLQGQLLGASEEEIVAFKVSLIQEGEVLDTILLDQTGAFEFLSTPPGNYTLCFHTTEVNICVPNIYTL